MSPGRGLPKNLNKRASSQKDVFRGFELWIDNTANLCFLIRVSETEIAAFTTVKLQKIFIAFQFKPDMLLLFIQVLEFLVVIKSYFLFF